MDYFNESDEEMKKAMMQQNSENEEAPEIIPDQDLYGEKVHFYPENNMEAEKLDGQLYSKNQMEIEPPQMLPQMNPLLDEINENKKPHTIPVSKVYYERCNRSKKFWEEKK